MKPGPKKKGSTGPSTQGSNKYPKPPKVEDSPCIRKYLTVTRKKEEEEKKVESDKIKPSHAKIVMDDPEKQDVRDDETETPSSRGV